jgi:hypothetical protein
MLTLFLYGFPISKAGENQPLSIPIAEARGFTAAFGNKTKNFGCIIDEVKHCIYEGELI